MLKAISYQSLVFMVLLLPGIITAQESTPIYDSGAYVTIGKSIDIHSNILEMDVNLKIHLPPGYESSENRYPVLYIFRDYFNTAVGLIEPLQRQKAIPDLIIVDFTNCRFNDFTPTAIEGRKGTGNADNLIKFTRDELFPFIDKNFRTQPYRIISSGSWGGLFSVYAVLTAPDIINTALAIGPWLIYDNLDLIVIKDGKGVLKNGTYRSSFYMLQHAESLLKEHRYSNNFLFFTGGDQPELTPSLIIFRDILKEHAPENLIWIYDPMPEQGHSDLVPYTIYEGLKSLYSDWRNVPEEVILKGKRALDKYEKLLAEKFGYDIGISKIAISSLGWKYFQENRYDAAIKTFRLHTEINPENANSFYNLARAYEANGDIDQAVGNYEKAIRIAEEHSSASLTRYQERLDLLKSEMSNLK